MSGVTPARRVRHDVRDGLVVMVFSLLTSCLVAGFLLVLVRAGN